MSNSKQKSQSWAMIWCLFILLIVELILLILVQLGVTVPTVLDHFKEKPVMEKTGEEPATSTSPVASEKFPIEEKPLPEPKVLSEYVQIKDSCDIHFEGVCVQARSGPGSEFKSLYQLRNDIVLKVGDVVEQDGKIWYKIVFDEWVRYPDRVKGDWYVSGDFVELITDEGSKTTWEDGVVATTSKKIIVDRSEQTLVAYEGDQQFMEVRISTGLELTPTPRGTFTVYKKTPSRYMQGPLPGSVDQQSYDLPGVPWNLYFTQEGAVIHGAYWHNSFGSPYSHGCVNVPPKEALELYLWAPLGTKVVVQD